MATQITTPATRSLDAVRTLPAWFFLLALALSWLDRALPNVFLDPIRRELELTDAQLGLLTGTPLPCPSPAPTRLIRSFVSRPSPN